MMYKIELTEEQLRVVQVAMEEYMRLRMGQYMDFCLDMAGLGRDLSPDNPRHDYIFNDMITRRNHLEELMRAFFRIAFEPTGDIERKTDDALIAEDIWDAIRVERGQSNWGFVLHVGSEPIPKIEKIGEGQ